MSLYFIDLADAQTRRCTRPGACVDRPVRPGRPPHPVVRPRPPRHDVRPPRHDVRPPRPSVRPPRHTRYDRVPHHRVRYQRPRDYYRSLPRTTIYRDRWARVPVVTPVSRDGYYWWDYPYYVHNGYQYRYSPVEFCDYELVDSLNWSVYSSFYGQTCVDGYDNCADLRDEMNWWEGHDRYFCAESFY